MTLTDVIHNYTKQQETCTLYILVLLAVTPKDRQSFNDFNVMNSAIITTEVKNMAPFMVVLRSLDITQKDTNRGQKVQTPRHKLLTEVKQSLAKARPNGLRLNLESQRDFIY